MCLLWWQETFTYQRKIGRFDNNSFVMFVHYQMEGEWYLELFSFGTPQSFKYLSCDRLHKSELAMGGRHKYHGYETQTYIEASRHTKLLCCLIFWAKWKFSGEENPQSWRTIERWLECLSTHWRWYQAEIPLRILFCETNRCAVRVVLPFISTGTNFWLHDSLFLMIRAYSIWMCKRDKTNFKKIQI